MIRYAPTVREAPSFEEGHILVDDGLALFRVCRVTYDGDGAVLAYTRTSGTKTNIYTAPFADRGGNVLGLTDSGKDSWPFWSPDGNWLLFTSERDGNAEIYIMDSSGRILGEHWGIHHLTIGQRSQQASGAVAQILRVAGRILGSAAVLTARRTGPRPASRHAPRVVQHDNNVDPGCRRHGKNQFAVLIRPEPLLGDAQEVKACRRQQRPQPGAGGLVHAHPARVGVTHGEGDGRPQRGGRGRQGQQQGHPPGSVGGPEHPADGGRQARPEGARAGVALPEQPRDEPEAERRGDEAVHPGGG